MDKEIDIKEEHFIKNNSNQLKIASFIFNLIISFSILLVIGFSIFMYFDIQPTFTQYIVDLFKQNIAFGETIYGLLVKSGYLNTTQIISSYIQPLAIVDILLFAIPFVFLQTGVFFLKQHMIKKENAILTSGITLLLLFVLIITHNQSFSFLNMFFNYNVQLNGQIILILLILQFLILAFIVFLLYKEGKIDAKHLLNDEIASKFVKIGAIASLITFVLIGSGLTFLNSTANQFRNEITINYKLNLHNVVNGKIKLDVPNDVEALAKKIGIQLPTEIKDLDVFHQFGLDNIDVGGIVNSLTLPVVDNVTTHYIRTPLYKTFAGIGIVLFILLTEALSKRKKEKQSIYYYLQGLFVLLLFFTKTNYFPITILFFMSVTLLGTFTHMYLHAKDILVKIEN